MSLSDFGYSCSSIALLKWVVMMGAKNVARSFIMIGLILNISLALLGFMLFRLFVTFSRVVCSSSKGGGLLVGGCCCCVGLGTIV